MNKGELNIVNKIELTNCISFSESDKYLIFRQSKSLIYISKSENKIVKEIKLELDNEFGYKRLVVFKDIVIMTIHPKKDLENILFGTPNYVELRAYSIEGLLWKRELKGWTMTINYGAFHVIDQMLFFIEMHEGHLNSILVSPITGEEIFKNQAIRLKDRFSNPSNKEILVSVKDKIFALSEKACHKITCSKNKVLFTPIINREFLMITSSKNMIAALYFEENQYKVILFDIEKEEVIKKIDLKITITIKNIIINPSSDKLVIISSSLTNQIICFDLLLEKEIWSKQLGDFREPLDYTITTKNCLHIYYYDLEEEFQIIAINNGEEIISIKSNEVQLRSPMLFNKNKTFLQLGNDLIAYE